MKRVLFIVGGLLLALLLVVLASAAFVLGTEKGTRWALQQAGELAPGQLSVQRLEGSVLGGLTLEGVDYAAETLTVRARSVHLTWHPGDLLGGTLHIERLHLNDIEVITVPGPPETDTPSEPPTLPDLQLPLTIALDNLRVRDLTVRERGQAEPQVPLEEIALSASLDTERLHLHELAITAPDFQVHTSGWAQPRGDWPLELAVDWRIALPEVEHAAGSGTVAGAIGRSLAIHQTLSAPTPATIQADLAHPLADLHWSAQVTVPTFAPRTLLAEAPEGVVALALSGAGGLARFEARASAEGTLAPTGPFRLNGTITRNADAWLLNGLRLALPEASALVRADGRQANDGTLALRTEWQGLRWPLASGTEPSVQLPRGQLSVTGTLDDYKLDGEGAVTGPTVPAIDWTLVGQGSRERLAISDFTARLLDGALAGQATVAWSPSLQWSTQLSLQDLDPGQWQSDWPGRLSARIESSGRQTPDGLEATAAVHNLSGTLRSYPVTGTARAAMSGDVFHIERLHLQSGEARVTAAGRVAEAWALSWAADVPNLANLLPDAGGTLQAKGRIHGSREAPRLQATADGSDLRWQEYAVGDVDAEADVGSELQAPANVTLTIRDLRAFEHRFQRIALATEGTLTAHRMHAELDADAGGLRLSANGGWTGERWDGRLERLRLTSPAAGVWRLTEAVALSAGPAQAVVAPFCLSAADDAARLCGEGRWAATAGWQGTADIHALPLALAEPFLPEDFRLQGHLNGQIQAAAVPGDPIFGTAQIRGQGVQATYPAGEQQHTATFRTLALQATAADDGLQARMEFATDRHGRGAVDFQLPAYGTGETPLPQQPLRGNARLDALNLNLFTGLSPVVESRQGILSAELALAGTVARPQLSGRAGLDSGAVYLPDAGISLATLQLGIDSLDGGGWRFEAAARSGDGTLRLQGETRPGEAGLVTTVSARGERFELLQRPDMRLWVSPDLKLRLEGRHAHLTGTVTVPEARIEPKELPSGAVTASQDVEIVGGTSEEDQAPLADSPWRITGQVTVRLGDDVRFEGFGLEARMAGEMTATMEPNQPTSAVGALDIAEGTYTGYGQDLRIEEGQLVFAGGPIQNPNLDIRATRTIRDPEEVLVGFQIDGSLQQPEIGLFSEPPLSETDILSYLLLGKRMGQASQGEGEILANAATSLGLKQGNRIMEQIRSTFGLEELELETSGEDTALVVGTYLDPRLYISYSAGLFDTANAFRLRYELSSKWTLEAQSGEESGADLLYTIERGR